MMNYTSSSSSSSSDFSRAKSNKKHIPNVVKSCYKKRAGGKKNINETRHKVYRGVRQRNWCKWVSEVREPNKKSRIWLGTFSSPEMAAKAHDVAALALRGELAKLNFPESACQLTLPQSSSVVDIQKAAFKAATSLNPNSWDCPSIQTYDLPPENGELAVQVVESSSSSRSSVSQNISPAEDQNNPRDCYKFEAHNNYVIPFLDEEEIFDMPGLINSMAEGMLLTPPAMKSGFNWDADDIGDIHISLWTDS